MHGAITYAIAILLAAIAVRILWPVLIAIIYLTISASILIGGIIFYLGCLLIVFVWGAFEEVFS